MLEDVSITHLTFGKVGHTSILALQSEAHSSPRIGIHTGAHPMGRYILLNY